MLPPLEERNWSVRELAKLCAAHGFSRFVVSPLVEPNHIFFPDPWRGGEPSVARLARRLLHYAGIDDLDVHIEIVEDLPASATTALGGVWLDNLDAHVCRFAVTEASLRDPSSLAAALARATAQAFRARHVRGDREAPDAEVPLVDLTTVYLGFGLLTTDAALRHHAKAAGGMQSQRSVTRLGVLGPRTMSYALALQLAARNDRGGHEEAIKRLQSNPSGFVKSALHELRHEDTSALTMMKLPTRSTWPPAPSLEDFIGPAEIIDAEASEVRRDMDRGVKGKNVGKPVFRVERSMARRLGYVGMFGTLMLGGVGSRSLQGIDINMMQVAMAAMVLGALGVLLGRFLRESRCSEPQCGASLDTKATQCPRCGGTVRGTIGHPKERLAAEDRVAGDDRAAATIATETQAVPDHQ